MSISVNIAALLYLWLIHSLKMPRLGILNGMERRILEPLFFLLLLVGTLVVAFFMFRPFLYTLILAGIIAYLTWGMYLRVRTAVRSASVAALLMTASVLIALLVPLTLIGLRIAYEASGVYTLLSSPATQQSISARMTSLQDALDGIMPGVQVDTVRITERLGAVFNWLVASLGSLVGSFATLVMNFILLLFFYFYLVRDGHRLKARLMELSPLADEQEEQVLGRIGRAITATVRGSLVLALLQGLVAGVGFALFGVPSPALWGTVAMLAAFVPTIGTALVQVPAVIFVAASGDLGPALGLSLWALIAVGMLDNFLGPKLMSRGIHIHPMVMLLAVLGGITFYGPMGVVLGPITIALLYALLDIYQAMVQRI
jgi:predicted PurR-regulated permease PerM